MCIRDSVYVVVAVLFKAGDHVPEIPLLEVVGNGLNVAPAQIGSTWVNIGVKIKSDTLNAKLLLHVLELYILTRY